MSEPSRELMVTTAIWARAFWSICWQISSICWVAVGSSTCAKSLTYPVGCSCETDSARSNRSRDTNRTTTKHAFLRYGTPKLYKTTKRGARSLETGCLERDHEAPSPRAGKERQMASPDISAGSHQCRMRVFSLPHRY